MMMMMMMMSRRTTIVQLLLIIIAVVSTIGSSFVGVHAQQQLTVAEDKASASDNMIMPMTNVTGSVPTTTTTSMCVESAGEGARKGEQSTADAALDYIFFVLIVQLLGCLSQFLLNKYNLSIPYAAVMFIWGAAMGGMATYSFSRHNYNLQPSSFVIANSVMDWLTIDWEVLLLIFLPGLIFKEAVEIPINLFLVASVQILILAFPMVLVGTALVAVAGKYCLPYDYESPSLYGWWAWTTLGAILASTDPIAVASVLKTAGASPRLVMHIAGESLLNDGSSYVFFTIAADFWFRYVNLTPQNPDVTDAVSATVFFFRMAVGGTLVGALFGGVLLFIIWELDRRLERKFDIIQIVAGFTTAYLCYFVCDQFLEMSGIIAVVACGLVINRFGRGMINDEELMSSYLALSDFFLNTLLFALGGAIWASISFAELRLDSGIYHLGWADAGWLFFFYIMVVLIRFLQMGLFYPLLSQIGLKSNWKEGIFLAFGGLHGSVGVALGLALLQHVRSETDENDEIRKAVCLLQFLGGGVTLLTLSINGSSAGFILKQLGLAKPPVSAEHTKEVFEGAAKDFIYDSISDIFQSPLSKWIDFAVLEELTPFVTKQPDINVKPKSDDLRGLAFRLFTESIAGEGVHYLNLLTATGLLSYRDLSSGSENEASLLGDMRRIFLDILKDAYKLKLELGELDQKEDNGYLFDVLVQSVDLACNEVKYSKAPIEDWQYTEMLVTWGRVRGKRSPSFRLSSVSNDPEMLPLKQTSEPSYGSRINERKQRRKSRLSSLISKYATEEHQHHKVNAVLRAVSFEHAHKMAETKLQMYVNRFDDKVNTSMRAMHQITQSVLETVLAESRDQRAMANKFLQEVGDHDMKIIFSHYYAKALNRRLLNFTERKAKDGLLTKQVARTYFREMEEKIRQADLKTVERLDESRCDTISELVTVAEEERSG